MSSTSREDKEQIAREFFRSELLPLARKQQASGHRYFETGPDDAAGSYFVRRSKTRWTAADFESQSVQAPEALAKALADFWTRSGDADLAALAPKFAALATQVYDVDAQDDNITPFMYVMF